MTKYRMARLITRLDRIYWNAILAGDMDKASIIIRQRDSIADRFSRREYDPVQPSNNADEQNLSAIRYFHTIKNR